MNDPDDERRRSELVTALAAVRGRIADACAQAGRDPRSVTLIAVTKTWPATDVATLVRLGVRDVGENRDQEASAKFAQVRELLPAGQADQARWHFLGRIQSRKCRSIASYADCVHALDRVELVPRLSEAVAAAGREPLEVFVQLSLDGDPQRGGVVAGELARIADEVASAQRLRLLGLMAVAPLGADPDEAFAALADASASLRADHPQASAISAGMSGDLEAAVRHGATHVRVGSALLGRREPVIG